MAVTGLAVPHHPPGQGEVRNPNIPRLLPWLLLRSLAPEKDFFKGEMTSKAARANVPRLPGGKRWFSRELHRSGAAVLPAARVCCWRSDLRRATRRGVFSAKRKPKAMALCEDLAFVYQTLSCLCLNLHRTSGEGSSWFNPGRRLSTTQPLAHSLPGGESGG